MQKHNETTSKKLGLDPKRAKINQKSSFWRLVSVSWGWGNPQGTSEQYTQTVIKDKMTHEWFLVFSECWICPVHLGFESISVYYIVAQDGAMATQTNQFIVFSTRYGWSDYLSHTLAQTIIRIKVRFYFGHARTYSWLHRLRNTKGKMWGTYLGNIYGMYKDYIWGISINIYDMK